MWNFAEAYMIEMWIHLQQHISELTIKGQKYHQEECDYGILQWKKQLNLERGVSGVSVGASLLQAKDSRWFPSNEALDKVALLPVAFAIKSLTSMKMHYSNTEWEELVIHYGLEEFHQYCFTN